MAEVEILFLASAMSLSVPLSDVTNLQVTSQHKLKGDRYFPTDSGGTQWTKVRSNNPYAWKCLDECTPATQSSKKELTQLNRCSHQELFKDSEDQAPHPPTGPFLCNALIQFKCHQAEYSSPISIDHGQYVVVQGDRGIDIGVIVGVNREVRSTYVERTGPLGSVLRFATQREVDYWATDLKDSEARAEEFCRVQVLRHSLDMRIVQAEYQFDQKKLTFYYEAQERIDFVHLLKELYREFGCRIWMEKVSRKAKTPE